VQKHNKLLNIFSVSIFITIFSLYLRCSSVWISREGKFIRHLKNKAASSRNRICKELLSKVKKIAFIEDHFTPKFYKPVTLS
jgi:hypothetical protein